MKTLTLLMGLFVLITFVFGCSGNPAKCENRAVSSGPDPDCQEAQPRRAFEGGYMRR